MLQASKNSGIQNADFEEKKKIYAVSPYEITKAIAKENEWTKTQIGERQEKLSNLALKAWKVDL